MKILSAIFISAIVFISTAQALENGSISALDVVMDGRAIKGFRHARIVKSRYHKDRWKFEASNEISNDPNCNQQIIPSYWASTISASPSSDVKNLYVGLVLERKNHGMTDDKNLTFAFREKWVDFSSPANNARFEILALSERVATVQITASSPNGDYSTSGIISAIICEAPKDSPFLD